MDEKQRCHKGNPRHCRPCLRSSSPECECRGAKNSGTLERLEENNATLGCAPSRKRRGKRTAGRWCRRGTPSRKNRLVIGGSLKCHRLKGAAGRENCASWNVGTNEMQPLQGPAIARQGAGGVAAQTSKRLVGRRSGNIVPSYCLLTLRLCGRKHSSRFLL